MRIGLTGIFVDDQDRAERFYTEVLGFHVKTNAPYGDTERWLSVVSPEDPDGVRAGAAPDRRAGPGVPGGQPGAGPAGDLADHRRLRRLTPSGSRPRGVVFVKEPGRMAYGGMDAVFDDTCGNLINLHQD